MHLKRYAAPKTWIIKKKEQKFITRPAPGTHKKEQSAPINVWLTNLGLAKNSKEAKTLMKHITVDERKITQPAFPVGFQDILTIGKDNYKITINTQGKLEAQKTSDKNKTLKVTGKGMHKGKIQLHLSDGRNLITDKKEITPGDSITIELPTQKILSHTKLAPGAKIIITGGKSTGKTGKIKQITETKVIYESEGKETSTKKEYAYATP